MNEYQAVSVRVNHSYRCFADSWNNIQIMNVYECNGKKNYLTGPNNRKYSKIHKKLSNDVIMTSLPLCMLLMSVYLHSKFESNQVHNT